MSAALRRKIAANTGIPPSVLNDHGLWSSLETSVSNWSREALDGAQFTMKSRILEKGIKVSALTADDVSFQFSGKELPGLCLVAMNPAAARLCVAKRLNESAEALASASTVLLRLTCEAPACALASEVASAETPLVAKGKGEALAQIEPVKSSVKPDDRYILMTYRADTPDGPAEIRLALAMEKLIQRAAYRSKGGETSDPSNGRLRPTILTSTVHMQAVLGQLPMTLGECLRMEVGEVIDLPDFGGRNVSITVDTLDGSMHVAVAELGTLKSQRAVKFTSRVSSDFTRGLTPRTAKPAAIATGADT